MPRKKHSSDSEEVSDQAEKYGIEVKIVDFETDTQLPQVHMSKTRLEDLIRSHRYMIFVLPGRKFGIEVTAHAGFDWGDANALEVEIGFDLGNVVNQKRVYLQKRYPNTGKVYSRCIDQIFMPHPQGCTGEASPHYFVFTELQEDIGRDDCIQPAQYPASEKVSKDQGKIRVEVTRKVITAGRERHPGLQDTVLKVIRSGKQALLKEGLAVEIRLEKVDKAGVMQYGSAFRPAACNRPSDTTRYVFEFLYRSATLVRHVIQPQFLAELSVHPVIQFVLERDPLSALGPRSTMLQQTEMPSNEEATITVPVKSSSTPDSRESTQLRTFEPSTAVTEHFSRVTDVSTRARSPTRSSNETGSVSLSDSLQKAHDAIRIYEKRREMQELGRDRDRAAIRHKLHSLDDLESEVNGILMGFHQRLEQHKDSFLEFVNRKKHTLEAEWAQSDEDRLEREERIANAVDTFVAFLQKIKDDDTRN